MLTPAIWGDSLFPFLKRLCPKDCQDQDLLELLAIAYKTNKKNIAKNKKKNESYSDNAASSFAQTGLSGMLNTPVK